MAGTPAPAAFSSDCWRITGSCLYHVIAGLGVLVFRQVSPRAPIAWALALILVPLLIGRRIAKPRVTL